MTAAREERPRDVETAELLPAFGDRLERTRLLCGVATQAELAALLGVHRTTVHYWCAGRSFPRPAELRRLCDLLRVTADWLLFGRPGGLTQSAFDRLGRPGIARQGP